jgi:hypothetical protein
LGDFTRVAVWTSLSLNQRLRFVEVCRSVTQLDHSRLADERATSLVASFFVTFSPT